MSPRKSSSNSPACAWCGKEFLPYRPFQRFCSDAHRIKWHIRLNTELRQAGRAALEHPRRRRQRNLERESS
jgi:hypothetical protein